MRSLAERVEVTLTEDAVEGEWELRDVAATMAPYGDRLRAVEAQIAMMFAG
ncbi:MAG TPA: hypothetical protein VMA83_10900 [Solirubrobacteraceae bacterium]|nr:hypothetical protein [Solirubrobacteraceae bacterium]